MSLIGNIISKIPAVTINDIKSRQIAIINQMKAVAEKIKAIDRKSGEELLSYLGTVTANAVGIPITIPPKFGLAVAGFPLGIFLLTAKVVKLSPLYNELKSLKSQFETLVKLLQTYEEATLLKETQVLDTTTFEPKKEEPSTVSESVSNFSDSIAKATGLDTVARSANLTNNQLLAGLGIGGFLLYKKLKNRKKRKK